MKVVEAISYVIISKPNQTMKSDEEDSSKTLWHCHSVWALIIENLISNHSSDEKWL